MLGEVIPEGAIYGVVSLYSPREQDTTLHVGARSRGKGLAQRKFNL